MPIADLVLQGGGAKGPGLVGAVTALVDRPDPYEFHRIAGTSAGALVASFLAAGMTPDELQTIAKELDFADLRDEPRRFRHARIAGRRSVSSSTSACSSATCCTAGRPSGSPSTACAPGRI